MAYMSKLPPVKSELFKRGTKAIAILVLLTSCSSEWHINRAIKKDPTILHPTTFTIDTIVVTESHAIHDTFVSTEYDTMVVEDSFVYTQIVRERDVIKVYTKCKGDTIRITKSVNVPQVIYKERTKPWELITIWAFIVLLLFGLIKKFTR